MELRAFGRLLSSGFALPEFSFKEANFLPKKSPKSLFETLRSKRFVRGFGFVLVLVMASTFAALQANADPTARGENSTIDRYLQVNIGGPDNQYAQHPNTYFMGGQTNGTWEAWIYPTNNNSRQPIFSKEASYIFGLDSGRLWSAISNGTTWIESVSDVHVPMNSWSHVAFIKIGTSIVMYLNGEETMWYPNGAYQTVQDNSNPLTFGWRNQWERFNGRLDEIRIWTSDRRNLIASNMHSKIAGSNSIGLHGYWDFNEPSGNTVFDRTTGGYIRDLTLVNSPTRADVKTVSAASNGDTVITFNRTYLPGSGNWTVPAAASRVRALVVAGGGGGGGYADGGGGGAGGVVEFPSPSLNLSGDVKITVGQGGRGGYNNYSSQNHGLMGQDSYLGSVRALGGGGGGGYGYQWELAWSQGWAGGSGGGHGEYGSTIESAAGLQTTDGVTYAGATEYGNPGGRMGRAASQAGSGGGGAGSAGGAANDFRVGGTGGNAMTSTISGTSTPYAAGGGGADRTDQGAAGGSGIGGQGGGTNAATMGTANTGSGGGGGDGERGAHGGSGVVIVRYTPASDRAVDLAGNINSSLTGPSGVIPSGAFTAEAWVYLRSNSQQTILSEGSSSSMVYIATVAGGDFYVRWGGSRESTTSVQAPINRWAHVALVRDGNGNPSFFLDGVQVWSSTLTSVASPDSAAGSSPFRIGIQVGDGSYLNGHVDQVKIWGVNLNADEIAHSMHSYGANQPNGSAIRSNVAPRAHYDFNEPTDSGVEVDRSGNTRHLSYRTGVNSTSYKDELIIRTGTLHSARQTFVQFYRSYLTASGGWTPPSNITKFKGVVVGGGGGGSSRHGGGGGAGELAQIRNATLGPSAIAVRVGQGGRGTTATASGEPTQLNRQGQGSSIGTITASGGGAGGGGLNGTLGVGGSGGGADGKSTRNTGFNANIQTTRADVAFFGNRGGDNHNSGSWAGGGGGGASAVGSKGSSAVGGVGGSGMVVNLTGSNLCLAAGGGGGTDTGTTGAGGTCSGMTTSAGVGSTSSSVAGTNALANSGSGGGGGGHTGSANAASGSGGSGVVILSYGRELEVSQTPRAARAGSTFSDPIIVRVKDANGNAADAGQTVTLSAVSGSVLTSEGTNLTSGSVTATTDASGVATFTGLGFQSGITTTQSFAVTADAYVGATVEVTPTPIASTVTINASGPTTGIFIDGVFQSNTSGTATILNSDLVTAMTQGSALVESLGSISVEANVVSTAAGYGVTLKAGTDVLVSDSIQVTTNNGSAVFWARSGATQSQGSQTGEGRIRFGNGATVGTNGGAIILAGSTSVDANGFPNGAAYVNASAFAIQLGTNTSGSAVELLSAGGQIRIYGETGSSASAKQAFAGNVGATNTIIVNSGTGTQDWRLHSSNTTDNVFEVWGGNLEVTSAAPSSPSTPAINVLIRTLSATSTHTPIQQVSGRTNKFIATGTGDINFDVTSANATPYAVDKAEGLQFLANGGAINVNFGVNGLDLTTANASNPIIFGAVSGGSSTSNVQISSDRFNTGTATAGVVVRTSGQATVRPTANSFSADPNFNATWSFVGNSSLTIGKTGNTRAVTVSGTNSVPGNLNIIGGNVTVSGAQTTTNGGNITITPSGTYAGTGALTSVGTLTISGGSTVGPQGTIQTVGNATFSGSGNFTNSGAAITSSTGNVQVTTSGSATAVVSSNIQATLGSITFNTGGAYSGAGTLNAGTTVAVTSAGVTIGGSVLASGNATYTSTGSLIQNANVTSSTGNVSMTISGASATYTKNTTSTITAAEEVAISSAASTVNTTGTGAISAGTVRLTSSTGMTSGAPITSRGTVAISNTTGTATVSATTNAAGNLTISSPTVSVTATQTTTNAGNITITPTAGYSGAGQLSSNGSISLSGGTTVEPTGAFTAAGNITISGSARGTFTAKVESTGGAVSINTGSLASTLGGLYFTTGSVVTNDGAVTLTGNASSSWGTYFEDTSRVSTNTGNITINGNAPSSVWGIYFTGAEFLSTSGVIRVDGGSSQGIVMGHGRETDIGSISTGPISSSSVTLIGNTYWDGSSPVRVRTSGPVVIESSANQFTGATTVSNHTFTGNSSLRIGKTTNARALTVSGGSTSIVGDYTVYGSAITQNAAVTSSAGSIMMNPTTTYGGSGALTAGRSVEITSTGGAVTLGNDVVANLAGEATGPRNTGVLIKTTDRIRLESGVDLTASGSDITLWADSDDNGVGPIFLAGTNLVTSNGGNIVFGGGLDNGGTGDLSGRAANDGVPDGYAKAVDGERFVGDNANTPGIGFEGGYQLLSGGGNIQLMGQGVVGGGVGFDHGVALKGGLIFSDAGEISIIGKGPNTCAGNYHRGIFTGWVGNTHIISNSTASDAIYMRGDTSACNNTSIVNASAIQGWSEKTFLATPNGGGINVSGTQGNASHVNGWYTSDILLLSGYQLISNTGPITIDSTKATTSSTKGVSFRNNGAGVSYLGALASSHSTGYTAFPTIAKVTSSSNVTINADSIYTHSTSFNANGHILLQPNAASFDIAHTMTTSDWSTAWPQKYASVTIGKPGSGAVAQSSNDVSFDAISASGEINVYGGNITVQGALSSDDEVNLSSTQDILINASATAGAGGLNFKAGRDVLANTATKSITTSSGGNIVFWANASGTGGQVDTGGVNVTINSNGGDIVIGGGADDGANGGVPSDGVPDNYLLGRTTATLVSTARLMAPMTSGAGDIVVRAQHFSGNSGSALAAVYLAPSVQLRASSGDILIEGIQNSGNVSTANQYGVYLGNSTTWASRATVISDSGDVTINGDASQSVSNNRRGIVLYGVAISAGGNIELNGASPINTGSFDVIGWATSTITATGNILVSGSRTSGLEFTTLNSGGVTTLSVGLLTGGDLGPGTNTTNASVPTAFAGAGSLVIEPYGPSFTAQQTMADVTIASTVSGLTIGKSGNTAGVTLPGAYSIAGNINVIGGAVTVSAAQSTTNSGNITVTSSGAYTGSGALSSSGNTSISATAITVGAPITAAGSSGVLLKADNMAVNRKVEATAGTGAVTISPATPNLEIDLGKDPGGRLSLVAEELNFLTASVVRIGEVDGNNSGTVHISEDLYIEGTDTLAIRTLGDVIVTGSIAVANLGIDANEIQWPGTGGDASVVALNAASAAFGQTADYSVAAVDGIDPEFGYGVKFTTTEIDLINTVDRFMAVKFNPPPALVVRDKFGNALAANNLSAGDFVAEASLTSSPAGSSLTLEGRTATRSGSTYSFTGIKVSGGTGEVDITFTVKDGTRVLSYDSDPSATSIVATYIIKAGFPDSLDVSMESTAQAGKTGLSPTVTLKDVTGDVLSTGVYADAEVSVSITSGTENIFIVSGALAIADEGVATFPNLVIGGLVGSNYVLTFTVTYEDEGGTLQTVTADSNTFSLSAGDANKLALDTSSQTVSNRVDLQPITVSIQDSYGNTRVTLGESDISLRQVSGPVTLAGTTSPTASIASKTFDDLVLSGTVGSYDLVFEADGLTSAVHTVELTHGVAHSLEITGGTSATNNEFFEEDVVVKILDQDRNLVTTGLQSEQDVVASAAGADLDGDKTTKAIEGIATFDNLRLTGLVGQKTLIATISNPSTITGEKNISLQVGSANKLALTTNAAGFANRVNFTIQPSVTVQDISGNTVPTSSATITVTSQKVGEPAATLAGDTSESADSGVATFTNLRLEGRVGEYDLIFSSGDLTGTTQRVTLNHGAAFDVLVSGPSVASNDQDLPAQVSVVLRDQDQNVVDTGPDSSRNVLVSNSDTETVLSGRTSVIASEGRATFTDLRLTGKIGSKTVVFSWQSTPNLSSNLSVTVTHGFATKVALSQDAASATSRAEFGIQPIVLVQDVSGNLVNDFTGSVSVEVSRSGTDVPFELTGRTTIELEQSNTATFLDVGLFGEVGSYLLTYRALDDRTDQELAVATQSITLAHGVASEVVVSAASTVANAAPLGNVSVAIRDQDGNLVTTGTPEVSLAVSGSKTVSLLGTTTSEALEGVASFTGLSILGLQEQKTLTATVTSLSNLSGSSNIELTFGAATQLALISGVTEAANRQVFTEDSVIEVRDSSGNPVESFEGSVSVSATVGTGVAKGTTTRTLSGSSARVTFDDLLIEGQIDSYVLTYSSSNLAITTQDVELAHGDVAELVLTIQSSAANDQSISDVFVELLDADENPVTTGTPVVTLSGTDLTGQLQQNASSGVATFAGLKFVGQVGEKLVTASLSSPAVSSNTSRVTLSHGVATQLDLTTDAIGVVNRAGMNQVPAVTLRDISGNPVLDSSASVQVSETSVGLATADISGTTSRTPEDGVVSFTGLGLNGQVGQYVLTFSSSGLADVTQTVDLTHGAAVKLGISSSTDAPRSGIDFENQPIIHVLDYDDNLVSSGESSSTWITASLFDVSDPNLISLSGEAGTLQVQASGGIAEFTSLRLTGVADNYTLDFTSGDLTKATQLIELLAGLPESLNIITGKEPSDAIAGEGFGQVIEVELLDSEGNRVLSDSTSEITATLVSPTDSSSRGVAVTTERATNGVVRFEDSSALNYTLAGVHKISFSDGTRQEVSSSFTITHAAAAKLVWVEQPAEVRNDIVISSPVVLELLDEFDNPVLSGPEVAITASVVGSGSLSGFEISGNTTTSTPATNLVSLNNLRIKASASDYVLRVTATNSSNVLIDTIDSSSFALTFGTPNKLVVTQSAAVAKAGIAFDVQPIVEIRDSSDNLVADSALTVTATVDGRTLLGETGRAASGGVVTFAGLGINGEVATDLTIKYSTEYPAGTSIETTQLISLASGLASYFVITEEPTTTVTRELANDVSLELRDAFGNKADLDSTTQVSLQLVKAGTELAVGTDGQEVDKVLATASQGVVTFENLSFAVPPRADYQLALSMPGFSEDSRVFEILPGLVASVVIDGQPSTVVGSGLTKTGELLSAQPVIRVLDADGYLATTAQGDITVSIASGANGSLSEGQLSASLDSGVATFTGIKLVGKPKQGDNPAQLYSLKFSLGSGQNIIESEISDNLSVSNNDAFSLFVDRGASNGLAGEAFDVQPVIRILDRYGNTVETGNDAALRITASLSLDGQLISGLTGKEKQAIRGLANFSSLALGGSTEKTYGLTFQVVGRTLQEATQSGVTVSYGYADRLAITQAPLSETGVGLTRSGDSLFQQPTIEIRDGYGNVVEDDTRNVTVTLVRVDAPLDSKDRLVDAVIPAQNGIASFQSLAMVTRPGETYKLRFTAQSLESVESEDISVRHGLPTKLEYVVQPASLDSSGVTKTGSALNIQPVLRLLDFDDNLTTEVSASVALQATRSTGTGYVLAEDADRTDLVNFSEGVATFENLSLVAPPEETQKLTFRTIGINAAGFGSDEITSSESSALVLTFSDPDRLAISVAPCSGALDQASCQVGITGNVLDVQPVIEIQDRFENRVTNFVGEVSVTTNSLGSAISLGVVTGVVVPEAQAIKVQVLNGLASFSNLSLVATPSTTPGEGTELQFFSEGLAPVSSAEIFVAATAPSKLAVHSEPIGARTGDELASAPIVYVLDRFGNRVLSDNQTVVSVSAATGTLGITQAGSRDVTVSAGAATFNGLVFTGKPKGPYVLDFTAVSSGNNLTGISSQNFSVANAFANQLVITSQPDHSISAIATGAPLAPFVLELRDFDGNLAEDDNSTVVEVSLVSISGGARFVDSSDQTIESAATSNILRASASGGVVRFDQLRLVGQPGESYRLIFRANPDGAESYDSVPTSPILLTHAASHELRVIGDPVGNLISQPLIEAPRLEVLDRFGNRATTDSQTSVSVGTYSGNGAGLSGTVSKTAQNGIVDFDGLIATGTPGERYKLAFSATNNVLGVQDTVGFTLAKVSSVNFSYSRVAYSLNQLVSAVFNTDSPATPEFTTTSPASICVLNNSSTGAITVKGVGSCVVDVKVPGTTYYLEKSMTATLFIAKAVQEELVITSLDNVDFMSTMRPSARGGSGGGPVSFLVEGDCRIIGGLLIPSEAGSFCELTARKATDANYQIAYSEPMTITVNKIPQSTLRVANSATVTVGSLVLHTTGGSGDGAVSYQISTPGAGCSISGDVLRATSNGSCGVMATKETSKNHLISISPETVFTFKRSEQSVFFTSSIPESPLAGVSFRPIAAASSGLAVTYAITEGNSTVCSFDAQDTSKVNFLTAGRCVITATQAGNNEFTQAKSDLLIVVGARNQTISFAALADRKFGQPAFMLQATASSGLQVSFQVVNGSGNQACTVTSAGLVTLTRAGDCSITATQPGDSVFLAAPPVTQLLRVTPDTAGAPHVVSISANNQSITASFNPPSYLGGSSAVGYRLEVTDTNNGDRFLNPGCSASGSAPLSCVIVGIPHNREYIVRVAAITQAGIGTFSNSSLPISTTASSQAVSNLIASKTSTELEVSWDAPVAMDGSFRSYEVYVWPIELGPEGQPTTPTEIIDSAAQTSVTFSTGTAQPLLLQLFSFVGGQTQTTIARSDGYFVHVATLTDGAISKVPANTAIGIHLPFTAPGLVSTIELTDLSEQLLVAWSTATFDGGHEILGYQIKVNGKLACKLEAGTQYCDEISNRMFKFSELALGESYIFEVAAVNNLGVGLFSQISHEMPPRPAEPEVVSPPSVESAPESPTTPTTATPPATVTPPTRVTPPATTNPPVAAAPPATVTPAPEEQVAPLAPGAPVPNPAIGATGDDNAPPVPFDPLATPEGVAALTSTLGEIGAVAGAVAAAAAAAAGAAASSGGGARGGAAGGGGSSGGSGGSGEGGSIANIDAAHEKYKNRRRGKGDRWKIWKKKWLNFMDKPTITLAIRSARFSPLFSKIVVDGAYLRASLGSFSLLPTLFGAIVAVWSALLNTTDVAPPHWQWLIVIAVLGIFDAFAGFVSTTLFVVTTLLMHGAIPIEDVRLLLGVVIVGYGPALLANAFRAFRKEPEPGDVYWWERLVDLVVLPFIGGWVTASMIGTLPALAGTTLAVANHVNDFAFAVAFAIMLRVVLEEGVARYFPKRLDTLHPTDVDETDLPQKWISISFRLAVFIFVTAALMGNVWQVWVGSALFILPTIIGFYADKFKNFPWIWRLLPTGIPGLAFTLLVASATTSVVGMWFGTSPDLALWSFALLPIPMLFLAVLAMFGREGVEDEVRWIQRPQFKWVYRIGGIVMLLVTMNLAGVI